MNYVDKVQIEGFWSTKRVQIQFYDDLNFLIGPNGSGKTTIINLLAAALGADIKTLESIQFTKILITLRALQGKQKPMIEITKDTSGNLPSDELHYTVKKKTSEKGHKHAVHRTFQSNAFRQLSWLHGSLPNPEPDLRRNLNEIVGVNWLSIQRGNLQSDQNRSTDHSFDSTVDQKLDEICRGFASYFSLLSSEADKESKNFQEYVLLSLLHQEFSIDDLSKHLVEEPVDATSVVGLLQDLGVAKTKATRSVREHQSRLKQALQQWNKNKSVNISGAITLTDASRISRTIEKWNDLQTKRAEIFSPRELFLATINDLFSGKEVRFDARNIPQVHLASGQEIGISALSSGEKQLFILLGESLLQENRSVVFISDEPELSLHVKWQNSLFRHVRKLNTSCQVISATHSPDIVGPFEDRIIQVEDCFSDV